MTEMAALSPEDRRTVEEGAREAAAHVLALLDEKESTLDFLTQLLEAPIKKQLTLVRCLVHIVSRTAVASEDMATFKLSLRLMAKEPMPGD